MVGAFQARFFKFWCKATVREMHKVVAPSDSFLNKAARVTLTGFWNGVLEHGVQKIWNFVFF